VKPFVAARTRILTGDGPSKGNPIYVSMHFCQCCCRCEFIEWVIVTAFMKNILLFILFILPVNLLAQDVITNLDGGNTKTVKSPQNRVALLELYTSEGCSSCPPADRFLSHLKDADISSKQLIPAAFHVTYWDYIGWKDRFADKSYDQRQRDVAHKHKSKSIYTPQFLLIGDDYRSYATFNKDINKLTSEKAIVDLELSARVISAKGGADKLRLKLEADISQSKVKDVGFYFLVIENNLSSKVSDGENDGEILHHDYVVRQLSGPYFQSKPNNLQQKEHTIVLEPEWKRDDLSIVAFAENPHTGEVLQAVRLQY